MYHRNLPGICKCFSMAIENSYALQIAQYTPSLRYPTATLLLPPPPMPQLEPQTSAADLCISSTLLRPPSLSPLTPLQPQTSAVGLCISSTLLRPPSPPTSTPNLCCRSVHLVDPCSPNYEAMNNFGALMSKLRQYLLESYSSVIGLELLPPRCHVSMSALNAISLENIHV